MKLSEADVIKYRPLVFAAVGARLRKAAHLKSQAEDLVQDGMVGLLVAAEKFDPSRQVKFSTYAYYWVAEHVRRGALRLHRHMTGRSGRELWERETRAADPDGIPVDPDRVCTSKDNPERQAVLRDLAEKLDARVRTVAPVTDKRLRRRHVARDADMFLERLVVDRYVNGAPLTQGGVGEKRQVAATEGSLPFIAKRYGVTHQRAAQIIERLEADVLAWGREIEEEAA